MTRNRFTAVEVETLRSQIVTSKTGKGAGSGGRHYRAYVFTEHGPVIAATILTCPQAVQISVYVVRAFVKLRDFLSANRDLADKLPAVERRLDDHGQDIRSLINAVCQSMAEPPEPRKPRIGHQTEENQ